jgi:hypothetical protein
MSDKKTIRVLIMGEVNTGKTTFGNLLVRAFREMGFLAEYQGEQVLSEDDIEKRLVGLLKVIDKVTIHEMQLPRGGALDNFLGVPRLPSAATGNLEVGAGLRHDPVMGDRVWVIKSWDPSRNVTATEIHTGVSRVFQREELGDYVIIPESYLWVFRANPAETVIDGSLPQVQTWCPHGRPAGHPCPHCMGINTMEVTAPPTLECPTCHTQVDMLIEGLCRRCAGMVTGS